MNIQEVHRIRTKILEVYPGWKKVSTMPDDQLVALYKNLQARGKVK